MHGLSFTGFQSHVKEFKFCPREEGRVKACQSRGHIFFLRHARQTCESVNYHPESFLKYSFLVPTIGGMNSRPGVGLENLHFS